MPDPELSLVFIAGEIGFVNYRLRSVYFYWFRFSRLWRGR